MGDNHDILEHLENEYTEPVRDPVWKHIYLSRALLRVVENEQFQKLDRIRQLGPACLVYPGATHTRRSHSLGVFHLARRMITTLVRRNHEVPISLEGVKAFLCAALLHDIGHYPFAHSLKDLAPQAHESLAARQILEDFAPAIRGSLNAEPQAVASIIDHRLPYSGRENVGFYAKLLSGVLDPDKLDYLNRDAFFCGVPYGIQDVDFILDRITEPARIFPLAGGYWPPSLYVANALEIDFTSGYDADPQAVDIHSPLSSPPGQQEGSLMATGIPQMLIVGMLNLIAFWFNNRGSVGLVPENIERLFQQHMVLDFAGTRG